MTSSVASVTIDGFGDILGSGRTWLLGAGLGAATLAGSYLVRFYLRRRHYPDGPTPVPFFGNMLMFKDKGHIHDTILNLKNIYGEVFTVWFGNTPSVIICGLEPALEAFCDRKTDFAGRPSINFNNYFVGSSGVDVAFADYGQEWEVLRRVTYLGVKKYAVSDRLPLMVADIVDEAMELVYSEHGGRAFDPDGLLYLITYNIIAQTAYGQKYTARDEEFNNLMRENKLQQDLIGDLLIVEFIPLLKCFYRKKFDQMTESFAKFRNFIKSKYVEHLQTYQDGVIRDFCDALIAAKIEAEAEQKDSSIYLNDDNLGLTLLDLFAAGTDTTNFSLQWMLLLMANFPDVQEKMRQELEQFVGDDLVTQEHRSKLNYIQAFISESLRFRPVVPLGVTHKTITQTSVAGLQIMKNTAVNLHHLAILSDEKLWDHPQEFRPERFLDLNGKHNSKTAAFVPFGIGRRACPGERLATADLLLILCRLLQTTKGHSIALPGGPGSADLKGDPHVTSGFVTGNYEILIK